MFPEWFRRAARRHGGALAIYVALSIAVTWPLLLHVGSAVPHDLGDPVAITWILWWNAHHLPLTTAWLNPPIFFPSPGAILFQDAFLGVWPFTTIVQAVGGSPLLSYNLLFIGSFAASAFAAYLLCVRVVGDRRAAFAGGLVFGFALYRMTQLAHLHILLIFWVPLILLGLHAFLASRRWRWLALAALCWAIQALTSGYFLVYSSVFVGLWALFFLRARLGDWGRLAVAFGAALAALWPWVSLYRSVHEQYGFHRGFGEADFWAADVASLVRAPEILAVWGRWLGDATKEGQLFPGVTLALTCAAVVAASRHWRRPLVSGATLAWVGVAALFGGVAAVATFAPTSFDVLGVTVSLGHAYKPMSWVWIALLLAIVTSPPVREVMRERSVPGFYALAAVAMWLFSLGPTARFMGHRIWYQSPFAWLLVVPGGDSVRVPARFWLLAVMALAVVVAHGLARLGRRRTSVAWAVTAVVCVGLVAEAWPSALPLHGPPAPIVALDARATPTPVLELPMETAQQQVGAMYRMMFHGAPVLNGYSGYEPPSLTSLHVAFEDGDPAALAPYAERTPIDIVIHMTDADAARDESVVRSAGAAEVTSGDGFRLYHLDRRPAIDEPAPSDRATIARLTEPDRGDVTDLLTDKNPSSFVMATELALTLARPCRADEVELAMMPGATRLVVRGLESGGWRDLWAGRVGERSVRAGLLDARQPRLRFRFSPVAVGELQVRLEVLPGEPPPMIQGVRVFGPGCVS